MKKYLGIDLGRKRVGLAYADEVGIAFPLPPILVEGKTDLLEAVGKVIALKKITHCVVGYPLNMDDSEGARAKEAVIFAEKLQAIFHLPVSLEDERLTTYAAESIKTSKKKQKSPLIERKTGTIDSRAAAIILQDFLDAREPS